MNFTYYLTLIFKSFYSKADYARISVNGRHFRKWLYLLLITFLAFLPGFIRTSIMLKQFLNNEYTVLVSQVPEINVVGGKAFSEVEQPFFLSFPEIKEYIFVLDTTGEIRSLDDVNAYVLMTEDKLYLRSTDNEIRIYDLAQLGGYFSFDSYKLLDMGDNFYTAFIILSILLAPLFIFIFRMLLIFLASLLFSVFKIGRENALDITEIIPVACAAITPSIIFRALANVIPVEIKGAFFISLLIFFGFLSFGIVSAVQGRKGGIPEDPPQEIL